MRRRQGNRRGRQVRMRPNRYYGPRIRSGCRSSGQSLQLRCKFSILCAQIRPNTTEIITQTGRAYRSLFVTFLFPTSARQTSSARSRPHVEHVHIENSGHHAGWKLERIFQWFFRRMSFPITNISPDSWIQIHGYSLQAPTRPPAT